MLVTALLVIAMTPLASRTAAATGPDPSAAAIEPADVPVVSVVLGVSPSGSVATGGSLVLSAVVGSEDPDDDAMVPAGSVEFLVDGVSLGVVGGVDAFNDTATLTVDGVGIAGAAGAALSPGVWSLRAVFTPDGSAVAAGEGSASLVVYFNDHSPTVAGGGARQFYADIAWLVGQGVTTGYADGGFHSAAPVSRQAMAAFLYRVANPGGEPPACTAAPFPDVSVSSPFCGHVTWLASTGITGGYADGGFHPGAAVSRQAMAAFVQRYAGLTDPGSVGGGCAAAVFPDVPVDNQFCGPIGWLVQRGITNGYQDGLFHPAAAVSRQAMAAFLHRLFGAAIVAPADSTVMVDGRDVPAAVTGDPLVAQTAVLPSGMPAPAAGGYLVVEPGGGAPDGVLGKVTAATPNPDGSTTVTTAPATLDQAFESYSLSASMSIQDDAVTITEPDPPGLRGSTHALTTPGTLAAAAARAGKKGLFNLPAGGWTCEGSASPETTVTLDLSDLRIDTALKVDAFGNYRFEFVTTYTPKVTASLALAGSASCTMTAPPKITFPVGGGLFMDLEPAVTFGVSGKISVDLDLAVQASAGFVATNDGVKPTFSMRPVVDVSADVGADGTVFAGAAIGIKLFGTAGVTGNLGPEFGLRWSGSAKCLTLDAGLKSELALELDLWVTDWKITLAEGTFAKKLRFHQWCFPSGLPTPVITSTTLPGGRVTQPYTTNLTVQGNRPGTWSITAGSPPVGLTLTGATISGTPTTTGTSQFRVRFTDTVGQVATKTISIRITQPAGGGTGTTTGTVWSWGPGSAGQLGTGATTSSNVPVQASGLGDVTAIAGINGAGYALRVDGTVRAWGWNPWGQLGNGSTADSSVPVEVTGLSEISAIAGASYTGYALRADGTVWAWGRNHAGQLGNGSTVDSSLPVEVTGLTEIIAIAGGSSTGYALRSDGTVWAWGWGAYGQLGNGGTEDSYVPKQVTGLNNVTESSWFCWRPGGLRSFLGRGAG